MSRSRSARPNFLSLVPTRGPSIKQDTLEEKVAAAIRSIPADPAFSTWAAQPLEEIAAGKHHLRYLQVAARYKLGKGLKIGDPLEDVQTFGNDVGYQLILTKIEEPMTELFAAHNALGRRPLQALGKDAPHRRMHNLALSLRDALDRAPANIEGDDPEVRPYVDAAHRKDREAAVAEGKELAVVEFRPLVADLCDKLVAWSLKGGSPRDLYEHLDRTIMQLAGAKATRNRTYYNVVNRAASLQDFGGIDVVAAAELRVQSEVEKVLRDTALAYPNKTAAMAMTSIIDRPIRTDIKVRAIALAIQYREDFEIDTPDLAGPPPNPAIDGEIQYRRWADVYQAINVPGIDAIPSLAAESRAGFTLS